MTTTWLAPRETRDYLILEVDDEARRLAPRETLRFSESTSVLEKNTVDVDEEAHQ